LDSYPGHPDAVMLLVRQQEGYPACRTYCLNNCQIVRS